MSSLANFVQHSTESSSQWNMAKKKKKSEREKNKKHIDQKGINNTIPICRWHNYPCGKSQGIYKNTPTTSKWAQQGYIVNSR